jgi:hypothetical protein
LGSGATKWVQLAVSSDGPEAGQMVPVETGPLRAGSSVVTGGLIPPVVQATLWTREGSSELSRFSDNAQSRLHMDRTTGVALDSPMLLPIHTRLPRVEPRAHACICA